MPRKERAGRKLPKAALLTRPQQYHTVYRQGKRLRGKNFSIILVPNGLGANRLGISIHGVKKAVKRNRIKRIIREFYRCNRHLITPPSDIVIAVRKDFLPDSPQQVADAFLPLLAHSPSSTLSS